MLVNFTYIKDTHNLSKGNTQFTSNNKTRNTLYLDYIYLIDYHKMLSLIFAERMCL